MNFTCLVYFDSEKNISSILLKYPIFEGNFIINRQKLKIRVSAHCSIPTKKLIKIKVRERTILAWKLFSVPTSSDFPASEQKDFGDLQKKVCIRLYIHSFEKKEKKFSTSHASRVLVGGNDLQIRILSFHKAFNVARVKVSRFSLFTNWAMIFVLDAA